MIRRRALMKEEDSNPEYVNDAGTVYHKHEVYEGTQSTIMYRNCPYMETFEAPNCVYSDPYNTVDNMFSGCTNLKSIKMPVAKTFGHYVFNELQSLEYLELGSVGNPFAEGGYFRRSPYTVGTDAGLTLVAYMDTYSATAGFINTVASNTTIIIRSSETGEILTE